MIRNLPKILSICAGTCAILLSINSHAQDINVGGLNFNQETGNFTDPPKPDGGWQALADLLKKIEPSVNTAIPLSASQIATRIANLIDKDQAEDAIAIIKKRQETRDRFGDIGTDVQLQYQYGRALSKLGQSQQAINVWQKMTEEYPELPEPWNAIAIEFARNGQLQLAQQALEMALVSDPNFTPALENLGHVQMRLAEQTLERAKASKAK